MRSDRMRSLIGHNYTTLSSLTSAVTENWDESAGHKPTVSLDVISLVASSCGYYRGQIEHRVAHEFAVHVATQRGLAKRIQHRHPPRAQPVAPMQERHCTSRIRKVRGRIADQVNRLRDHFGAVEANLSASNLPGAAHTSTADPEEWHRSGTPHSTEFSGDDPSLSQFI